MVYNKRVSRRVLVSKDGVTNFVFGWVIVIFAVSGVRYTLLGLNGITCTLGLCAFMIDVVCD